MKLIIKLLPILGVSVLTACTAGIAQNKCKTFLVEEGAAEYKYGQCTTDAYMSKKDPQDVKEVVVNKGTETVKVEEPKKTEEPKQPDTPVEPEKPVEPDLPEEPKVTEPPKPEPPPKPELPAQPHTPVSVWVI